MRLRPLALLVFPLLAARAAATEPPALAPPAPDAEAETLASWMTGTFDTFDQVARDEAAKAPYRHVRAVMQILPLDLPGLTAGTNGRAFYVEQASADALDRPYRQRVYLLFRRDGALVNRIHRLKDPAPFAGAAADPSKLKALAADQALPEEGCDLVWARASGELYEGAAGLGGTCRTAWRGATRAVSLVKMTPSSITSLDVGFDDAGVQKWGPPPGNVGHVFVKRGSAPVTKAP